MPRFHVPTDQAQPPFVLGLDVGSGGTRAAVYDASAREVGKRSIKITHAFTTGTDGTSTINADQIVDELLEAIGHVLAKPVPGPIRAIGFDTFASTLVAVDADGNALGNCLTYADTRSHRQAEQLRTLLDPAEIHERTGARLHVSYAAPRLLWLKQEHPDVFAGAHRFMALGEYVALRLLGQGALGTASAAWAGLLDRRTGEYLPELLDAVGVEADRLGAPRDPSESLPVAETPLAQRFPQLSEAVWVPVVGDGLTANIGIGAYGPGIWGISTATSGAVRQLLTHATSRLPGGLWAYRVDRERTLIGSAMSDCGRVVEWATSTLNLPGGLDDVAEDLFTAPPSPTTPLVLPFFSGERGTGWRGEARAVLAGISASTSADDLLRGALEGVALSYLRIADQLREVSGEPQRIILSGGMTEAVPGWLQLLADALQQPIDHVGISRSTMRGAAMLALEQVAPDAQLAEVPVQRRVEPVAAHAAYYRERLERFEQLAALA